MGRVARPHWAGNGHWLSSMVCPSRSEKGGGEEGGRGGSGGKRRVLRNRQVKESHGVPQQVRKGGSMGGAAGEGRPPVSQVGDGEQTIQQHVQRLIAWAEINNR